MVETDNVGGIMSLKKTHEQFIEELMTIRTDLTVLGEYIGANSSIRVCCNNCRNEWNTTPSKILSGRICPKCSKKKAIRARTQRKIEKEGSMGDNYPSLIDEWDFAKNDKLGIYPDKVSCKSNKSAYWICAKCGYEYNTIISNRTAGSGCPACSGKVVIPGKNDLFTVTPKLNEEWDYEKNNAESIFPTNISKGSEVKANWKCRICGHRWKASVYSRVAGSGCPNCAKETRTSLPEQAIFYYLKQLFPNAINTYQPSWIKPSEIDVYIPDIKLGIEYDGEGFHKTPSKDIMKDRKCSEHGIKILHVREPKCPPLDADSLVYIRPSKSIDQIDDMIYAIVGIINQLYSTDYSIVPSFINDRSYIYNQYLTRKKKNSVFNNEEAMLDWDYDKNRDLNPEMISAASEMRVWWKCHICGYESCGAVKDHMTHKCDVCGKITSNSRFGEKIRKYGRKDVDFLCPDLASEWKEDLNDGVGPTEYSYQSSKKIKWKCKKCGYVWISSIANRVNGQGCPKCAGKVVVTGENDLATNYPELVKQWVECIDDPYATAMTILPSSNKRVRWRCLTCGGEWVVSVGSRTRGNKVHGCPYCLNEKVLSGYNDLKTLRPDIASEWNYKKNGSLQPNMILNGSNKKVWWQCSKCGNEWECTVISRTGKNGSGCPVCSNKKRGQSLKKHIFKCELDGTIICEYCSMTEASRDTGVSKAAITNALKRDNGTSGGYRWLIKE